MPAIGSKTCKEMEHQRNLLIMKNTMLITPCIVKVSNTRILHTLSSLRA